MLDSFVEILNQRLVKYGNQPLNSAEILLLQGILLKSYIESDLNAPTPKKTVSKSSDNQQILSPPYPNGSVPLDSPFYLQRLSIEEQVYQEIGKPGALIRIKAPREMGKTSLLLRILDYGEKLGYYTVSINLQQTDQSILNDLNQLLRWLCANIARQLQLKPQLDEYWDEDLGSKISCTLYFQNYLLQSIEAPLILALEGVYKVNLKTRKK
ncbi:AAA-like domain-containing protein [Gloeothece verrucosa]|uniref:Serine/threonine protein kinase n=1 Tax=Gloeothece verrucosa (strain PCC 7822) TaxID=497965 RepID=E0UIX8_GLOV7|nr:AAA-like domain-containing protein [Gloeothece verrucosa]ADN14558.1 hypothetical protein Cyan7822_2587 [Gloeothece verrucosa PCC 7822]